jgi:hypothetical protein
MLPTGQRDDRTARQRLLCVKRMGGNGGATRSNTTTSRGKQKVNRRWEVEVVHQEAGMRQEDEQRRQQDNQPDKRHGRPWRNERRWHNDNRRHQQMGGGSLRRGNATTSWTKGVEGYGAKGNIAMRGGARGRSEVAV